MRASMRADGTTFRPRHTSDPAGIEDLAVGKSHRGDTHTDEVGVENHDCFGRQGATSITSAAWVHRSF